MENDKRIVLYIYFDDGSVKKFEGDEEDIEEFSNNLNTPKALISGSESYSIKKIACYVDGAKISDWDADEALDRDYEKIDYKDVPFWGIYENGLLVGVYFDKGLLEEYRRTSKGKAVRVERVTYREWDVFMNFMKEREDALSKKMFRILKSELIDKVRAEEGN